MEQRDWTHICTLVSLIPERSSGDFWQNLQLTLRNGVFNQDAGKLQLAAAIGVMVW